MNLYDIVTPMTMDEAKATKQRLDPKCWKGKHKEGTKIKGGVRVNNCVPNESVEEALSKKDLVKQVGDKLNDPEFRKQPADSSKRWEKGDLYQGPGPDDYGYTGYQGHGMPRDNPKKKTVKEDSWHAGDNAWSSENHEMFEGHSFSNGDQVELKPEYADKPGEVYTVSQCDVERGRCWIADADGRGWYARFEQLIPAIGDEEIDEHIGKVKGGYRLYSKHGSKNLGTFPTRAGAEKHEREVQYFKHAGESVEEAEVMWSKDDKEKIRRATNDFDDVMSDDPDWKQARQDVTKQRLKTKPMAGPKGQLPEQGVAEMDKSQKGAAGWNIDDYPLGAKGTTAKPTTVKNVVKSASKELNRAFDRTAEPQPTGVKKKNEFDIKEVEDQLDEKWSQKYKDSINCSNPKGFSQKAHCAGKKKHNESVNYWTKLQNERSTKLNSLVNELKESITK